MSRLSRPLSRILQTALLTGLLACLLAVLTPAPNARAAKGDPLEPVTIQLLWQHQFQFAGYYAALEQGYYREAGLDVTLLPAQDSQDPIDVVLQGKAEYGVAGPELVAAYAKGSPVVVLAPIFQHSPMVLVASAAAGVHGIPGLAGTTMAIEPGGAPIRAYLEQEGLDLSKVHVVPHSFGTQDLIEGRIQAMTAYITDEPFLLTRSGFPFVTFSPLAAGIDFYGDTLFTTQPELRDHPGRATRVTKATLRGWAWALDHPEQVVDLILARYTQRHDREHLLYEARMTKRLIAADFTPLGNVDPARWQRMADVFVQQGLAPKGLDISGLLPPPAKMP